MLELTFEGRAQGLLEFSPPERRQQILLLQSKTTDNVVTLFKVRCTASPKFRVRPALGIVPFGGETVAIDIHLKPQERQPFVCKLLVVCRRTVQPPSVLDGTIEQLKALWIAAEERTDRPTVVFSETVTVHVRVASDEIVTHLDDKPLTLSPPKLTTSQIADVVLLLMKSQSQKEVNTLTPSEHEQLVAAQERYPSDWPCWEEYASRLRTVLRERNKRKLMAT